MEKKNCLHCNDEFEVNPNNKKSYVKKFCSNSCSASFNNKLRPPVSEEQKRKVSEATKITWRNKMKGDGYYNWVNKVGSTTRGKYKIKVSSILELNTRTVQKIMKRIGSVCSNCGWDKTTCDIHHIYGRKIDDCDNHNNLSLLCPNCHRMAHEGLLKPENLKTLQVTIPHNWLDYYYG